MIIDVMDSVEWSKLNWDISFENTVDLERLLPQIGKKYELPIHFNQTSPKDGTAYIIWKPPHSDINGWYDKRPSEILKSYVIKGEIKTRPNNVGNFEFTVSNRRILTTVFEKLDKTDDVLARNSPFSLGWHKAGQLKHALVGQYIYISGGYDETWLEAIVSRDNEKLCLHYSAYQPSQSQFETALIRSYLSGADLAVIEKVIKRSRLINDNSMNELLGNKVFGADYC